MPIKGDLMGKMGRATKTAFDRVAAVTQTETDPDLVIYNKLKPEDFTQMMREHGEEQVNAYIQTMEHKKLTKGGRNA